MFCKLEKLENDMFDEMYSIMKQSFPMKEMRKYEGQKSLLSNKDYKFYGRRNKEGKLLAFMVTWEPGDFVYLEHFAVEAACRSGGIGRIMLSDFLKEKGLPMILEVELPFTDINKRRIGFYERLGFSLNLYEYLQLPLRKDGPKPTYLYFMTYPEAIDEKKFLKYKKFLTEIVYQTGVE